MLTYEEFSTLLTQIEAVLNSRPLATLSKDPDDLEPLTSSHFLVGRPLTLIPEPSLQDVPTSRLAWWQTLRQMLDRFWRRWLGLPSTCSACKHLLNGNDLSVNSLRATSSWSSMSVSLQGSGRSHVLWKRIRAATTSCVSSPFAPPYQRSSDRYTNSFRSLSRLFKYDVPSALPSLSLIFRVCTRQLNSDPISIDCHLTI